MKKAKIIVPVAILAIALLLFYIIVLHPRVKIDNEIQNTMGKWDVTNLGTAVIPYAYDYQPGEDWVVIEERRCRFSIPAYYIDQSDGVPVLVYVSSDDKDCLVVYKDGEQAWDPILNANEYDEETMSQLRDGFEQLGYGIPDSEYSSLKAILSVTDEDYDFWNINKAQAYSVLVTHKTDSYACINCISNGINRFCYYYESEDIYFIISEVYYSARNSYSYAVRFYHPDNLHYVYYMSIETPKPEVAFAIINSFELTY